jgi:hypothetical protein
MTDKYNGITELEILGEKRGFKVGTRSTILFCEMEKISMSDVEEHLKNGGTEAALKYFYCAAVAYSKLLKQPEPTFDDVCAWVDEFTISKMETELSKSMETPNSEAPTQEEGLKVS